MVRALLAFGMVALMLVGCGASPAPVVDPAVALAQPPRPMPADARERPVRPQGDGTFLTEPVSVRIQPGVPYRYEVLTHCGFNDASFDADTSFWDVEGPRDDGQGNPPPGVDNPADAGVFLLVEPDRALWVSSRGVRFELTRAAPGERWVAGCD